jgi:class 3 adenylate cyclase/tetratricopeptide (TPR) repeat protein
MVTVLFCDLVGSTALGERLDPEATRRLVDRYFDEMRSVVERHGGTVEKFIGDALMAVFGVPHLHEDDALRSVRAAVDMGEALVRLNTELRHAWGIELENRTGIATGEVIASGSSGGDRLVTGDAVNVAARLEQAAAPGEVLLNQETFALVGHAVRAQETAPLELRGKSEPARAFRLVGVDRDAPAFTRHLDTPLTGREDELAALVCEAERCRAERACRIVTILGEPGIGKSRLAHELIGRMGDVRAVAGRCLPYGDGVTSWPLREIVSELAGDDGRRLGEALGEHGAEVAERIVALVGGDDAAAAPEEAFWEVRRMFELLARDGLLIVLLDDMEHVQPTFADLVDYLVGFAQDAPILLVATARTELVGRRPSWILPRASATVLTLETLGQDDIRALVERAPEAAGLPQAERRRIVGLAEGNPLFAEQLLALAAEGGDGSGGLPPTLTALLAARLDRLTPDERMVVGCAAVEGKVFHRGAVAHLVPSLTRDVVSAGLASLMRHDLIRPDRAELPGEDGFRFAHVLLRDAAYASLPKETRSLLHEGYARWLRALVGDDARYDELLGHHLDQARLAWLDVSPADVRSERLRLEAADLLGRAGTRALQLVDLPAAVSLLERAIALITEPGARRGTLLLTLADALMGRGDTPTAAAHFEAALDEAVSAGIEELAWRARLGAADARSLMLELPLVEAEALARDGVAALERLGDADGLARAWRLLADGGNMRGDSSGMSDALQHARRFARASNDARMEADAMFWIGLGAFYGPLHVDGAAARCRDLVRDAATPLQAAHASLWLGAVDTLAGSVEDGLGKVVDARRTYADLGMAAMHGGTASPHAQLQLLAGRVDEALNTLQAADDELEQTGDKAYRSNVAGLLAETLRRAGRLDEAERAHARAAALCADDDPSALVILHAAGAGLAAARGELDEARRRANAARDQASTTDDLLSRAEAEIRLAEVLARAGEHEAADAAAQRGLGWYRAKGVAPELAARQWRHGER